MLNKLRRREFEEEKMKKKNIYIAIATASLGMFGIMIASNSCGKDDKSKNEVTTIEETTTTETTTELSTEEVVTEETTTEAITVVETTTVEETTTAKVEETTVKKEEPTEKLNENGLPVKYYEVLSTKFEPVNPNWVEDKEFMEALCCTFRAEGLEYAKYYTPLCEELIPYFDNVCTQWTLGKATADDIENTFKKNMCVDAFDGHWLWLSMRDESCTTNSEPMHFVIRNNREVYIDAYNTYKNNIDVWTIRNNEQDMLDRAKYNCHRASLVEMLEDGGFGGKSSGEYYFMRTYLDKSTNLYHIYLVLADMDDSYDNISYDYDKYKDLPLSDDEIYRDIYNNFSGN